MKTVSMRLTMVMGVHPENEQWRSMIRKDPRQPDLRKQAPPVMGKRTG